jgi:hypothetical protein
VSIKSGTTILTRTTMQSSADQLVMPVRLQTGRAREMQVGTGYRMYSYESKPSSDGCGILFILNFFGPTH